MFVALTVALILFTIIIHEVGHFAEMRKCGIAIDSAGIGIPIRKIPHIKFTLKRFPGVSFEIHLLLLGAYVKPKKEE